MNSTSGIILKESQYQRIHKDRHYVVFHQWKHCEGTNTSRTKCRSSLEEYEYENTWPAAWRSAINNRQTI